MDALFRPVLAAISSFHLKLHSLKDVEFDYKTFTLGCIWAAFAWEFLLMIRQYYAQTHGEIPKRFKKVVSQYNFQKSRSYGLDKMQLGFVQKTYSIAIASVEIYHGVYVFLWNVAGRLMVPCGYDKSYEIIQSIIFTLLYGGYSYIFSLPFGIYSTFVIEKKHGFNKQTPWLFFVDSVKGIVVSMLIGIPFLWVFLALIRWAGQDFTLHLMGFLLAFQFILMTIYPSFIAPLFNKYSPLEVGTLRSRIEALAAQVKYPLQKIFVVDGSKRSTHSNAYLYGFGKNKRIVLFDTLLKQADEQEIVAVMAHEIGHWAGNHVLLSLIVSQIQIYVMVTLFSIYMHSTSLFTSFGFSATEKPTLIGFFLFQTIYTPVDFFLSFFMNMLSRRNEFDADRFASDLGYGKFLNSSLVKLHVENLGNLTPDWLYSIWNYSHPPISERLEAIDNIAKAVEKKRDETVKDKVDAVMDASMKPNVNPAPSSKAKARDTDDETTEVRTRPKRSTRSATPRK